MFEKFDRVCRADERSFGSESGDMPGSDPNSGGKQEEAESGENADVKEKTFTETQVNKIVQARLERERARIEKEVENRLSELGFEDPEEVGEFNNWRSEREDILKRNEEKIASLRNNIAERDSAYERELKEREAEKREWRGKYESLYKRAQLTQTALKAGADPRNVDMIVTFTEGSVKLLEGGNFQIVDKEDNIMLDPETGADMTLEKFMADFLSERPGLVRATASRGAGTGAMHASAGRYSLDEIRQIAKSDPLKYAELKRDGVVQAVYEQHLSGK